MIYNFPFIHYSCLVEVSKLYQTQSELLFSLFVYSLEQSVECVGYDYLTLIAKVLFPLRLQNCLRCLVLTIYFY